MSLISGNLLHRRLCTSRSQSSLCKTEFNLKWPLSLQALRVSLILSNNTSVTTAQYQVNLLKGYQGYRCWTPSYKITEYITWLDSTVITPMHWYRTFLSSFVLDCFERCLVNKSVGAKMHSGQSANIGERIEMLVVYMQRKALYSPTLSNLPLVCIFVLVVCYRLIIQVRSTTYNESYIGSTIYLYEVECWSTKAIYTHQTRPSDTIFVNLGLVAYYSAQDCNTHTINSRYDPTARWRETNARSDSLRHFLLLRYIAVEFSIFIHIE